MKKKAKLGAFLALFPLRKPKNKIALIGLSSRRKRVGAPRKSCDGSTMAKLLSDDFRGCLKLSIFAFTEKAGRNDAVQ
jgi:hypothetical protein